MQPIVDGLEGKYSYSVVFQRINVDTQEGFEIFRSYSLMGHPSYILLDETGNLMWKSVGEQSQQAIEAALLAALE